MRLKADENLAAETVGRLRSRGFDVATVREEGLAGAPDDRVASAAEAADDRWPTDGRDAADHLRGRNPAGRSGCCRKIA